MLGDEGRQGVEDQNRAHKQGDHSQYLHDQIHAFHKRAPPVLLGVLVDGRRDANVLFGQTVLDLRGHVFGKLEAVGFDSNPQLTEFPLRDTKTLQPLGSRKEIGIAAKLRWGHKRMADFAGNGQRPVGFFQFKDDFIANVNPVMLTR